MKFFSCVLVLLGLIISATHGGRNQDEDILHKCLTHEKGDAAIEDLKKVVYYSNWTVEEIPCFTRCISSEKGWFDQIHTHWNKQRIVDDLGADMYNYCRYELNRPFTNACEFAHKGLKCLKQAELQISMTYANLLDCVRELNATMEQLHKYGNFAVEEEIPCLFTCFAERMHFYSPTNEWQLDNWIKAFGPVKYVDSDSMACKTSAQKMEQRDKCTWMYDEYICLEQLNYNTDGSSHQFVTSTTVKSLIETKAATEVKETVTPPNVESAENTTHSVNV